MKGRFQRARAVVVASSGNFLEMYDFMVFGYFAPQIARTYFPSRDAFASLMLALMTFGAGFLMRPVGAVLLGAFFERHGRRSGLVLTLALMAVGTLTIALTPGYSVLGPAAPLMVVAGRLVQGLSAGVEVGGVSVYLSEIAPPAHRGFYVAWQSASQQVAVVFASLAGLAVTILWTPAEVMGWAWRIPFAIGCLLLPFLLLARRLLEESPEFVARPRIVDLGQVASALAAHWGFVLRGALATVMTTVFFYMLTAYAPTYGSKVLHLSSQASFLAALCVGASNFVLLPAMGALSDRVGRVPVLLVASATAAVVGYPSVRWLVADPSLARLLTVELVLAVTYAAYNGALIAFLTEIAPPKVRITGFSLAYSLATALFGGFTPAIATLLLQLTGDRAALGAWASAAAAVSLLTVASFAVAGRGRVPHAA